MSVSTIHSAKEAGFLIIILQCHDNNVSAIPLYIIIHYFGASYHLQWTMPDYLIGCLFVLEDLEYRNKVEYMRLITYTK